MAGVLEEVAARGRYGRVLAAYARVLGLEEVVGKEEVRIGRDTYEMEPFTADELMRFINDFISYIAPYKKEIEYRNGKYVTVIKPYNNIAALLQAKAAHILAAGQIIKKAGDMGVFYGYFCNADQYGFREIKPSDIMRTTDTTETPSDTWSFSFSADEGNWIGYSTGYGTAVNIDKELGMCVTGIANLSDSQVVEQVYFKIGNIDMPPIILKPVVTLADSDYRVPVKPIPTMIFKPKDTVFAKAYCSSAATNEVVLLGVTFGKGRKLHTFKPTSVDK